MFGEIFTAISNAPVRLNETSGANGIENAHALPSIKDNRSRIFFVSGARRPRFRIITIARKRIPVEGFVMLAERRIAFFHRVQFKLADCVSTSLKTLGKIVKPRINSTEAEFGGIS